MATKGSLKTFSTLIEKYGMVLERGNKHYSVTKDGVRVGTVSGSGETNALRQAVRDLARQGLVDDAARRVKF